jgi:hypothetical protein
VKNIIQGNVDGKVSRGRPRDKCMGQMERVRCKEYQEESQLELDGVEMRAAVNQSKN